MFRGATCPASATYSTAPASLEARRDHVIWFWPIRYKESLPEDWGTKNNCLSLSGSFCLKNDKFSEAMAIILKTEGINTGNSLKESQRQQP